MNFLEYFGKVWLFRLFDTTRDTYTDCYHVSIYTGSDHIGKN